MKFIDNGGGDGGDNGSGDGSGNQGQTATFEGLIYSIGASDILLDKEGTTFVVLL